MGCFALGQGMQVLPDLLKALRAARVVFGIMDSRPGIDPDVGASPSSGDVLGDIVFENIKFSYPTRPDDKIFELFNITNKRGQSCALVGLSGSGKSTILCLLQRLYEVQGQIKIMDKSIDQWSIRGFRQRIGVVSQQPVLFTRSIVDNITFSENLDSAVDMERVESAARAAHIHKFIISLPDGYNSFINSTSVSGGQKQRLCIARAFYMNPDILLLDEATSALDAESEQIVQTAIDELVGGNVSSLTKHKPTTIVVAHRLNTIRNCDIIHVMHGGNVIESGTHDELVSKPNGHYLQLIQDQLG